MLTKIPNDLRKEAVEELKTNLMINEINNEHCKSISPKEKFLNNMENELELNSFFHLIENYESANSKVTNKLISTNKLQVLYSQLTH